MRKPSWSWKKRIALLFLILLLVVAVCATSPWWYTWLVWTKKGTSWVEKGTDVDPTTYVVKDRTLTEARKIPKIIHQTWKDENIPEAWRASRRSCQEMHPDYEYKLWTDDSSREFLQKEHPGLLETWDSYPFNIQRADIIRYAVLQTYGGFYLDLDITCLHPLDFMSNYPVVLPKTWPVGFSNDFIASEPNNPFMIQLVRAIPNWNVRILTKYITVMFSTGPMFVTLKATFYNSKKDLWVLSEEMYNKYTKSEQALFIHLHGSSWHGEDAKRFLWIKHHPIFLAALTLTGIVIGGGLYLRRVQRRRTHRLKSQGKRETELKQITVVKNS